MVDFIFNGQYIMVKSYDLEPYFTKLVYKACSGEKNYQRAKHQNRPNLGPITEHTYSFYIKTAGQPAKVVASNTIYSCEPVRHTEGFIEHMPSQTPQYLNSLGLKNPKARTNCQLRLDEFGKRRVPLKPFGELSNGRSGFYIHDSKLGETNGCIEVEEDFFNHVQAYENATSKESLTIEVKYPSEETITNYDEAASRGITKHLYPKK
ncbi:MAG: hypothetical protein RL329_4090 [Bacteroidota bacterium]|jgi:hypothetical protein